MLSASPSAPSPPLPERSLFDRLDSMPLGRLHVVAAVACAFLLGVDLTEISLGSALSVVFSTPPHKLGSGALTRLLAAVFAGAILGAPLLGWIAKRRGLAWTLTAASIWLALTSCLAAASSNAGLLTGARFLSGFSLGGLPPLIIAYITDLSPAKWRARLIFALCALAYLAPPASIFLLRWLTPITPFGLEGWRWPFLLGGILSALAGLAIKGLPESPRWALSRGRSSDANALCARLEGQSETIAMALHAPPPPGPQRGPLSTPLFQTFKSIRQPAPFSRFGFVGLLYFLSPWATTAFPLLVGPVLLAKGYSFKDALLFVGLATFSPALGAIIGGRFIDLLDRRVSLALCAGIMVGSVVCFFFGVSAPILMAAMVIFGVGSALYLPAMTLYGAELFSSTWRADLTSAAWSLNRVAAVLAPVLLLPLLHQNNSTAWLCLFICASLGAGAALVLLTGPKGAPGQGVDEALEA